MEKCVKEFLTCLKVENNEQHFEWILQKLNYFLKKYFQNVTYCTSSISFNHADSVIQAQLLTGTQESDCLYKIYWEIIYENNNVLVKW